MNIDNVKRLFLFGMLVAWLPVAQAAVIDVADLDNDANPNSDGIISYTDPITLPGGEFRIANTTGSNDFWYWDTAAYDGFLDVTGPPTPSLEMSGGDMSLSRLDGADFSLNRLVFMNFADDTASVPSAAKSITFRAYDGGADTGQSKVINLLGSADAFTAVTADFSDWLFNFDEIRFIIDAEGARLVSDFETGAPGSPPSNGGTNPTPAPGPLVLLLLALPMLWIGSRRRDG